MQMSITPAECDLLIEVLQAEVTEVRSEHYHAESHDVKELLRTREDCAKGLLARLRDLAAQESGADAAARPQEQAA